MKEWEGRQTSFLVSVPTYTSDGFPDHLIRFEAGYCELRTRTILTWHFSGKRMAIIEIGEDGDNVGFWRVRPDTWIQRGVLRGWWEKPPLKLGYDRLRRLSDGRISTRVSVVALDKAALNRG